MMNIKIMNINIKFLCTCWFFRVYDIYTKVIYNKFFNVMSSYLILIMFYFLILDNFDSGFYYSDNINQSNNVPDNNQLNLPQGDSNSPSGGPNNPQDNVSHITNQSNNNQDDDNTIPYSSPDDQEYLREIFERKLRAHRISRANTHPYDTTLGDNFTSQEHEYLCERIMQYKEQNPRSSFATRAANCVSGRCPDRRYTGGVGLTFIENLFAKK
jgi:hypothetical protein